MLNLRTFQTAVASKAARCRLAAPDARLADRIGLPLLAGYTTEVVDLAARVGAAAP